MVPDTFVIYHCDEEGCWIAHSLRMDQIGTGDSVIAALADAIKATRQVTELAASDPTIELLREAPADIQKLAHRGQVAPRELFEIAKCIPLSSNTYSASR